ncbi:16S rRNA (guanine(966)-N(2))-methyltransferase RsmD [Candidatus Bipolaricaulota bacterium]
MRIIAGSKRGRRLVDWEESGIRPVRDFVRHALFSIVADFVPEAVCLDLYAGTGSLGLEALSRGARSCLFVDHSRQACGVIRRNLEALDLLASGEVFEGDSVGAIERYVKRGRRFDLVFIDPPYELGLVPTTMEALADGRALSEDPVVVAATGKREEARTAYGALSLADRRRYGDNLLLFYRLTEEASVDRSNATE